MCNEFKRLFTTALTRSELEREIAMAEALIEHDGTGFPDSSFEDGYIAAINFVLGNEMSNVEEEYKQLRGDQDE
ncbi:hypothetical protein [Shewanella sp. NIFS-20-20]|uniref:hypothetical protein n=1 Tax=Shewanella sp. NIFS-20-20 TaxID=2853806 RepID=UPI001C46D749|nr:hypothetical protein [Shewanella sp. NIFS-20-20]MBV7315476.1 hypothetical protein [Shewanella sp. NIFS-20-20]